jgi:rhamnose transport system permease protein
VKGRISPFLFQRLAILLAGNLVLLLAIGFLIKEGGSFREVLTRVGPNVAPVILAGLGLTGIIFTGSIDLSIASIVVVAGTIFAILVHRGLHPIACYVMCATTAWSLSLLNGCLVRTLKIPAIIITLAGLPFYRGIALIMADLGIPNFGGNLSVQDELYHAPGKLYSGWILSAVLLLALVWEAFGKTPRRWLALGNSEEACRLLGLRPEGIRLSAFLVGGLFLGLAALIYVTRVQSIEPARMALGFELQVIGAVVLGGTNIFGGEGSFWGTVLGALFLYLTGELLIYAGVSAYFQEAITGALIITVIGMDCLLHRKERMLEEIA